MNQRHFAGNVGQIQRFFDSGVAAADHSHFLIAVEEAVTGGTGRNPPTRELLFRGQPQIHGRSACGNDQGITGVLAGIAFQFEGALAQFDRMNMVKHHFGLEAAGMLLKAGHQFRTHHAINVCRPVIDLGGGHQLSSLGQPRNQHRLQVGAGGVDRRGVAGRTGTEDQQGDMAGRSRHDSS